MRETLPGRPQGMGSRGERACGARLHRSQRASGAKARTLVFAHNEAGSC